MLLEPVPGSAAGVLAVADAVGSTGRRLAATAATLGRMRDGAVWDGPAGEAFGARIGAAPGVLDAAARRFLGAVAPLRAHAGVLEEQQAVAQRAVLVHREAWEVYDHLETRAVTLLDSGLDESAQALLVVRQAQQEEVASAGRAEAAHAGALEALRASDARCAAVLEALARDGIGDPVVYRGLRLASEVGHGAGYLAMTPVKVCRPLAVAGTVGEGVGTVADGVLLVGYGEGSWTDVGIGAATTALGASGESLRLASKSGATVLPNGAVVARSLTVEERLRQGVVAMARARVAAAAERFGRPVAHAPERLAASRWAAPVQGTGVRNAVRRAVRHRLHRVDTELQLVTAGGRTTERMYAGGVALEAASKVLPRVVPEAPRPEPASPVSLPGGDGPGTRRSSW